METFVDLAVAIVVDVVAYLGGGGDFTLTGCPRALDASLCPSLTRTNALRVSCSGVATLHFVVGTTSLHTLARIAILVGTASLGGPG